MAAPEVIDAGDAPAHAPAQGNAPWAPRAESDYWMRVAQCMLNDASRIESMGEYVGTFGHCSNGRPLLLRREKFLSSHAPSSNAQQL